MPYSGMLCHVALVRTDDSEECSTSIIRVTRIGELGTTLAVTNNGRTLRRNDIVFLRSACQLPVTANAIPSSLRRNGIVFLHSMHQLPVTANVVSSSPILVSLMMEVLRSSKTLVLTRATW
jgi:hypothetical protein